MIDGHTQLQAFLRDVAQDYDRRSLAKISKNCAKRGRCNTPPGDPCYCTGKCREPAVAFPLMTEPQSDTTERKRLEMQAIPWALPEKQEKPNG